MNDLSKNFPYLLFDRFCLRTPIFSFDFFQKLHNKPEISDADYKKLFANKIIQEAIYIASPDLFVQLEKWSRGVIKEEKKIKRILYSFLKYLNRMSTRCTPFGLFAVCAMGEFSKNKSSVVLKSLKNYRKDAQLDSTFLANLLEELAREPELKQKLSYFPNSSLYKISHEYRYVEHYVSVNKREYALQSVKWTNYLEKVLTFAEEGKNISTLSKALISEGFSEKDSLDFIESLIENQILVSEIEPTVTGKSLLDKIHEWNCNHRRQSVVQAIQKNIRELNQTEKEAVTSVEKYKSIRKSLQNICPDVSTKHLFQVDLFSEAQPACLNKNLKPRLQEALSILNKITFSKPNPYLEKFKNNFTERYDQEEVCLTKVLDPDTGIGYGIEKNDSYPFLEDIHLPVPKEKFPKIRWSSFDDILLPLVIDALKNNRKKITLTKENLSSLEEKWDDLPMTISSIIEIYKNNDSEKIYMNSAAGSSAANLLTRFCLGSEEINEHVENIIRTEEKNNAEKIYAEIVHLPQVRMGNILRRPAFRKYEIPYLAKSGLPKEFQIPIQDLMVSVKGKKIILRSKKMKKEIIPRHTNAHNYILDALPVYHFLCDLQTQNQRAAISFQWSPLFEKFGFLPRVEHKNIILAKAVWNIKEKSFKKLFQTKDKNLMVKISVWREELRLPRYANFVERDNKLLIDFENIDSIHMFLNSIKNKKTVQLEEFLFDDEGIVKRGKEQFCNQFIISFRRNNNFAK